MRLAIVTATASLVVCSCVFVTTRPRTVSAPGGPTRINVPARAHLIDGSVVVYDSGLAIVRDTIRGRGMRYDLLRSDSTRAVAVPLDSVVGVERYDRHYNYGSCVAASPAIGLGGVLLFKAIFGSCPTVYTFDGAEYNLEAEAFSYSISRIMEDWDLDRLDLGRPVDGEYRLMVTNEALETHYINSLSLAAVDCPPGCEAFPTDNGEILLFGRSSAVATATSRDGRDVVGPLGARDGEWFETDTALVRMLADSLVRDWIDIAVPVPDGARNAVLALRFRNTLLNTVWLYDIALRQQGLHALDWPGTGLRGALSALRLDRWYWRHFGLHILAPSGRGFREIARIRDTGPITWHETAVEIPVPDTDTLRLRLDFVPDNWVIDWVGVSFENPGRPAVNAVGCDRVEAADGTTVPGGSGLLERKDRRYLVTGPTDCYYLVFTPPPAIPGSERAWFVRAAGYYTEWLRPDWLRTDPAVRFEPSDRSIVKAAELWLEKKPEMERLFFESKLPTRRLQ